MLKLTVQIEEGAASQMILTIYCPVQEGTAAEIKEANHITDILLENVVATNSLTVRGDQYAHDLGAALEAAARKRRILPEN